ncbi:MAG: hypothetical protein H6741_13815 [Alphaproteobacteria bacterium]|nr:hypothetical protein [Alphaproteobacteria bacterium]
MAAPSWTAVHAEARVLRADYPTGPDAFATSLAVGLEGNGLLLISPPGGARGEALREALAQLGELRAIVAPNGFHRMGVAPAAARFPEARVFAPERAVARVQKACPDKEVEPLAALVGVLPPSVELLVPPHLRNPDLIARIHVREGVIWSVTDIVLNMHALPANLLMSALLRLLGFQAGLHVNAFGARFVILQDRAAFKRWLLEELERLPPLAVVFGHGEPACTPEAVALFLQRVREEL